LEHSANEKDLQFQRELVLRRQAELERWGQHQREIEKMKAEAKIAGDNRPPLRPLAPAPRPVVVPQGSCVLSGSEFRCNPDAGGSGGYFQGDSQDRESR